MEFWLVVFLLASCLSTNVSHKEHHEAVISTVQAIHLEGSVAPSPRSSNRGLTSGPYFVAFPSLSTAVKNNTPIYTKARACTILPNHIGVQFHVHNGKHYIPLKVTEDMVGHKLGEFAATRKKFSYRLVHLSVGGIKMLTSVRRGTDKNGVGGIVLLYKSAYACLQHHRVFSHIRLTSATIYLIFICDLLLPKHNDNVHADGELLPYACTLSACTSPPDPDSTRERRPSLLSIL